MFKLTVSPPNLVHYQKAIFAVIDFLMLLDFHNFVTSPTYVHHYSFERLEVMDLTAKYAKMLKLKTYETSKNH